MVGLVLNFGLILLSVRRLIQFLTTSKLVRFLSYASIGPICFLFINQCFQMMAACWAIPAYNLNNKLHFADNGFNTHEYFQRSVVDVRVFQWSHKLSLCTPLVFSVVIFALLFGLSYNPISVKAESGNNDSSSKRLLDINETIQSFGVVSLLQKFNKNKQDSDKNLLKANMSKGL